ncbi:MAG: hypothetical protein ACI9DK_002552 [Vicingaceae bacterium]
MENRVTILHIFSLTKLKSPTKTTKSLQFFGQGVSPLKGIKTEGEVIAAFFLERIREYSNQQEPIEWRLIEMLEKAGQNFFRCNFSK